MNKVKSTVLAAAFLGTITALVTFSTTLMSSQEQSNEQQRQWHFSLPLTGLCGS